MRPIRNHDKNPDTSGTPASFHRSVSPGCSRKVQVAVWKTRTGAGKKPSTTTIARAMKKAAAGCSSIAARLHGRAGSRCGDAECAAAAAARPQWAALPLPLQRLSPHSLSRRVRDLLTGDLVAHPDLPVDPDPEPELPAPETPPVIESTTGGCRPADAAAAWDGRHELEDLAGIVDVLTDVNRRAAELVKGRL